MVLRHDARNIFEVIIGMSNQQVAQTKEDVKEKVCEYFNKPDSGARYYQR